MIAADVRHMMAAWNRPSRLLVAEAIARSPFYPSIRAMLWVRSSMWFWRNHRRLIAQWCKARAIRCAGVEVHPGACIGPGFAFVHSVGIVVGKHVVAGRNLVLYQGVTLGDGARSDGQPSIGNDVRIGAGAKVLGSIQIGNGVRIGANAVVLADVPDRMTVVGVRK